MPDTGEGEEGNKLHCHMESCSVTQGGVQCVTLAYHNLCLLNSKMEFCHVVQADLKILGSSDLPASAPKVLGLQVVVQRHQLLPLGLQKLPFIWVRFSNLKRLTPKKLEQVTAKEAWRTGVRVEMRPGGGKAERSCKRRVPGEEEREKAGRACGRGSAGGGDPRFPLLILASSGSGDVAVSSPLQRSLSARRVPPSAPFAHTYPPAPARLSVAPPEAAAAHPRARRPPAPMARQARGGLGSERAGSSGALE
ncbi:hypothetical protein AAY473_007669 [Plecturocebus cupreus]